MSLTHGLAWPAALEGVAVEQLAGEAAREQLRDEAAQAALARADCAIVEGQASLLPVMRRIHSLAPALQLVMVVDAPHRAQLERVMLFEPGLGEIWLVSPEEVGVALVTRAADVTRRRRRFARTTTRISASQHALPAAPEAPADSALVSQAFLAGLLRVLPDPVFTVDAQGHLLSTNDAGDRLLEQSGHLGWQGSLWEVVRPVYSVDLTESADARTFQAEVVLANGQRVLLEARVAPIRAGDVHARVVVTRDRTEEQEAQILLEDQAAELEAQAAELEERQTELHERIEVSRRAQGEAEHARAAADAANAAKSQFLATMSHELRTPLNAIIGYAQLLELEVSGALNEQQRGYLTRLERSGAHLLGLINDVLDLSKIDAGGMAMRADRRAVRDSIDPTLATVAPQAEQRGIVIDVDAARLDCLFVGDEQRVRQILVNLLSNAVKFSEPGALISLACGTVDKPDPDPVLQGGGPWTYLRVTDTGIGIPPELQGRVFEPFMQVEGGHTRAEGGTGLGLAISRRFARLMGGDLVLDSEPGVGSAFTLWLPGLRAGDPSGEEQPLARSARARGATSVHRHLALRDLGLVLREDGASIATAFVARVRADALFHNVRHVAAVTIEDHLLAFLADLSQDLVMAEEGGGLDSREHRDSAEIARAIAERHGRQRRELGWTEAQLAREYTLLMDELETRLNRQRRGGPNDIQIAVGLLGRAIAHSRLAAVTAFRRS